MTDVTVIGSGFMGEKHIQAIVEHPTLRLASVVDADKTRADEVRSEYGAEAAHTDYETALDGADAAVIATPERFHEEQATAALDRDIHALIEKPITEDIDAAATLMKAATDTEAVTGVSFILRYDPSYAEALRAAREGKLGELVAVRAKRGITASESRRIGARGHPLFYMNIHDIDAILTATDQSVTEVVGFERCGELSEVDVPDATQAIVRFEGGLTATIEGYGTLPNDTPGGIDAALELVGTKGVASVDTPGTALEIHGERYDRPDTRHWPVINGKMDGAVAAQIDWFAAAIKGGSAPLASVRDGYRAQLIAESIRRAIETDRPVSLEDPGPASV